jgi:hypothetical protein
MNGSKPCALCGRLTHAVFGALPLTNDEHAHPLCLHTQPGRWHRDGRSLTEAEIADHHEWARRTYTGNGTDFSQIEKPIAKLSQRVRPANDPSH